MFKQADGGQGVECDALNVLDPKSGTIRRYDFIGIGVALLEEMCHCGVGFEPLLLAA